MSQSSGFLRHEKRKYEKSNSTRSITPRQKQVNKVNETKKIIKKSYSFRHVDTSREKGVI